CNGGCPKDRFIETTDGDPGLNYLCAGYESFFGHVDGPMRMMADLLRRKRAPAEIMAHYASEDRTTEERFARAARNEPCPCGSPRKFKKCHGAPSSAGGENPEADAGRTA
ncbi:MAG: SEC-C domain-containing protein, partial [Deltaproteobacteria bacterium]|nr:SEC-C domain-containing protein [Deltaproteobacteria bacterium]